MQVFKMKNSFCGQKEFFEEDIYVTDKKQTTAF
jgi:hypothetical protein